MSNEEKKSRTATDLLIGIEDKIGLLIKTVASNEFNNKLILDRLNQIVSQNAQVIGSVKLPPIEKPTPKVESTSPIELSDKIATMNRRTAVFPDESVKLIPKTNLSDIPKFPVVQRITDNKGKDIYMAQVIVTDLADNEVMATLQTSSVGKWQTYLPVGKYSVHISKVIDPVEKTKFESLQEFEVLPGTKGLQLPVAIIKR